jgi:Tfp pilus assembly protein PilV
MGIKKHAWAMAIGILVIAGVAAYFGLRAQAQYQQAQLAQQQANNTFALQSKCSDAAAKFFVSNGYKTSDGFDYKNHFNTKLNKCFILVSSYSNPNSYNNLNIDLYDALEGAHYAEYEGHANCAVAASLTNIPKICELDQGNIWFDGNDTRNPADYHIGFSLSPSSAGDSNTQAQFIDHIQPFMTD